MTQPFKWQDVLKSMRSTPVAQAVREAAVSATHVARWGDLKLEILAIETGLAEVTMQIIEESQSWTSVGPEQQVRKEVTLHIQASRSNSAGVGVASFKEHERAQATAEFERLAGALMATYFPATAHMGKVAPQKCSMAKRAVHAGSYMVLGAALVIGVSLLATSTGSRSQSVDPVAQLESDSSARAPAAWDALPQAQKDVLLQMAANATGQITPDQLRVAMASTPVTNAANPAPVGVPAAALSADQMKTLASLKSLKMGSGAKVFYSFEDPMCPSCQDFATQSRALDKSFGLMVIPVGFQPGGRDKAAAALCSANPTQEWATVMSGLTTDAKPCDAGYKIVDNNNAVFQSFGMSATPTLVGANGAMVAGSAPTLEIAAWVNKNLK